MMHFIRPVRFLLIDALMLYLSKNSSVFLVGLQRFTSIGVPPSTLEQGKRLLYSALISVGALFCFRPLVAISPIHCFCEFGEGIMKITHGRINPLFFCGKALYMLFLIIGQFKLSRIKAIRL